MSLLVFRSSHKNSNTFLYCFSRKILQHNTVTSMKVRWCNTIASNASVQLVQIAVPLIQPTEAINSSG